MIKNQFLTHLARSENGGFSLRELRHAKGLTQAELAERMGVSQHRISMLETGRLERSKIDTIQKYLNALDGEVVLFYKEGEVYLKLR